MQAPPVPDNEQERLAALRKLVILDTPPTETLDQLTRTCARMLRMPITLVSLVDADRQWFKSRVGLDTPQTPRAISFCGHVVASNAPLIVQDALSDPRFDDNPLVTGELHLRAYLGVPVHSPEGLPIGTLCAADHRPRQFTAEEVEAMIRMGRLVSRLLLAEGASRPEPTG
ncbi:MAG: GAF domain-containing protein [Burkholderiales bacterium]